VCGCNKARGITAFKVIKADGTSQEVKTEQEARSIVRINGGSYTPVKK
jgi:hypothetical protein